MFGLGKTSEIKEIKAKPVRIPDEDEPAGWRQYPENKRARTWYSLESIAGGGAPPAQPPAEGQDGFTAYSDAARKGDRCAQYALGKMYLTGTMTSQNTFQAGLWLSRAAEQGSPFACFELAKMMSFGIGLKDSRADAGQLYEKAYRGLAELERQSPTEAAEKKLAVICEKGLCKSADKLSAGHWKQLAEAAEGKIGQGQPETQPPAVGGNDAASADAEGDEKAGSEEEQRFRQMSGTMNIEHIPAGYIFPAKDNRYAETDTDDSIRALALSVQVHGLINPLTLRRVSDTEYRIIAGEKRFKAVTQCLHWKTVPAVVKDGLSDNDAQLMLNAANLHVRQYTAGQKLQFYMDYERQLRKKENGELTDSMREDVSKLLGLSSHQIRKYQRIVEMLPARKLRQVKNGKLSIERAYKMTFSPQVKRPGRTSETEDEMDAERGRESAQDEAPGSVPEEPENRHGRTSEFENETDAERGRESAQDEAPESASEGPEKGHGCTSEFENETDAKRGREPAQDEAPGSVPEGHENRHGRTSEIEDEADAERGRESAKDEAPGSVPEGPENRHGRTSETEDEADAERGREPAQDEAPGSVPEGPENRHGRTSEIEDETDAERGRESAQDEAPESAPEGPEKGHGRTSEFEDEADAERGRESAQDEAPESAPEGPENGHGRTSKFKDETDAEGEQEPALDEASESVPEVPENGHGRTSETEDEADAERGREPAQDEAPESAPEGPENGHGRTSETEDEADAERGREPAQDEAPESAPEGPENGHGRTSEFEDEADASNMDSFPDPQDYHEALRTLARLPAEPGQPCAVLSEAGVKGGEIYRIEVYSDALLISVLVDEVRYPYPASEVGKTLFLGPGCFSRAKAAQ